MKHLLYILFLLPIVVSAQAPLVGFKKKVGLELVPNIWAHFDANDPDGDGNPANNTASTYNTWSDISGNGYDLDDTGTNYDIDYVQDAYAGFPAYHFNYSNGPLYSTTHWSNPVETINITMFLVIKKVNNEDLDFYYSAGLIDNNYSYVHFAFENFNDRVSATPLDNTGAGIDNSGFAVNNLTIIALRYNSTTGATKLWNRLETASVTESGVIERGENAIFFMNENYQEFYIFETIFYDSELTDSEVEQNMNYLIDKYDPEPSYYPGNITDNLIAWYDAEDPEFDGLGVTNGGLQPYWYDKSGNGYRLEQSNSALRPNYGANDASYNNQGYMDFQESDRVATGAMLEMDSITAFTEVIVYKADNTSGADYLSSFDYAENNDAAYTYLDFGSNDADFNGRQSGGSAVTATKGSLADNGFRYQINTWDTSDSIKVRVNASNGTPATGANMSLTTHQDYTVGNLTGSSVSADYFDGRVYEIMIYNTELTSVQINSIESYIQTKYGL